MFPLPPFLVLCYFPNTHNHNRKSYNNTISLISHLTSGWHLGTDHRCPKCLKRFPNPVNLVAHMESSSQRCKIRETAHFAGVVYVVSGGYLDICRDERGDTLDDGNIRLVAPSRTDLAAAQKAREVARRAKELERMAYWRDR